MGSDVICSAISAKWIFCFVQVRMKFVSIRICMEFIRFYSI